MEDCLPSEVARLVLGYLQKVNCMKSWKTFLVESPSLQEYCLLYNSGKIYSTNVDDKSLLEILSLYRSLRKYSEIIEEIKRWENEYNFNPDTRKNILEEIANMIGLTFKKYLPSNNGNTMNISTSSMITCAVPYQQKANISDNSKNKATVVDNLHENIEESENIETNASNVASEITDEVDKLPNICEVYSLNNTTGFDIPDTETNKISLRTALLIDLTKDKDLEMSNAEMGDTSSAGYKNSQTYSIAGKNMFVCNNETVNAETNDSKIKDTNKDSQTNYIAGKDLFAHNNESINAETGDSNVKDSSSAMNKDSQTNYIASKNLLLCNNGPVNNGVVEMCGSDCLIVPESPTNVEADDFPGTTVISQTILKNADKSAAPVLSNRHNMEKIREMMTDLNNGNHTIKNLELIESSSNNFSQNSLLCPNAQVNSDNYIELNSVLSNNKQDIVENICNFENKQNIVNEVSNIKNKQNIVEKAPNFENKLGCLNNGIGSTLAPNSYQFTAVNTLQVPTIPTYILTGNVLMPNTAPYTYVINPFSQMSLPVPSISSNDIQNPNSTTVGTLKSDRDGLTLPKTFLDKSSTSANTKDISNSKQKRKKSKKKEKAEASKETKEKPKSTNGKRSYSKRLPKRRSLTLFPSTVKLKEALTNKIPTLSITESPYNPGKSSAAKGIDKITNEFEEPCKSPMLKLLMNNAKELVQMGTTSPSSHIRCLDFNSRSTETLANDASLIIDENNELQESDNHNCENVSKALLMNEAQNTNSLKNAIAQSRACTSKVIVKIQDCDESDMPSKNKKVKLQKQNKGEKITERRSKTPKKSREETNNNKNVKVVLKNKSQENYPTCIDDKKTTSSKKNKQKCNKSNMPKRTRNVSVIKENSTPPRIYSRLPKKKCQTNNILFDIIPVSLENKFVLKTDGKQNNAVSDEIIKRDTKSQELLKRDSKSHNEKLSKENCVIKAAQESKSPRKNNEVSNKICISSEYIESPRISLEIINKMTSSEEFPACERKESQNESTEHCNDYDNKSAKVTVLQDKVPKPAENIQTAVAVAKHLLCKRNNETINENFKSNQSNESPRKSNRLQDKKIRDFKNVNKPHCKKDVSSNVNNNQNINDHNMTVSLNEVSAFLKKYNKMYAEKNSKKSDSEKDETILKNICYRNELNYINPDMSLVKSDKQSSDKLRCDNDNIQDKKNESLEKGNAKVNTPEKSVMQLKDISKIIKDTTNSTSAASYASSMSLHQLKHKKDLDSFISCTSVGNKRKITHPTQRNLKQHRKS